MAESLKASTPRHVLYGIGKDIGESPALQDIELGMYIRISSTLLEAETEIFD